jgi:hypothetical protein
MTEGSIEHQRLSPACQQNLKDCRKALTTVQLSMVEAMGHLRKAMAEMPPGEAQVLISKSLQQRFQPAEGTLNDLIGFIAQLESYCRGGEVNDIARRISQRMLEAMTKPGGLAVEIFEGRWRFSQEADPSMTAGKKRMEEMMRRYSADESKAPEE